MRKLHFFSTLVALSLATSSLWATPSVAVNGKLPGMFSVACGEYVYFSQGNLQYRASADGSGTDLTHEVVGGGTAQGTWRFAEEQFQYVGNATAGNVYIGAVKCNNNNISQTYTGWIDLFGWGTSGWDNTAVDATSVNYQPYSKSNTALNSSDPNYNNNRYLYGPSLTNVDVDHSWLESDDTKNYDWGVYNAISNGGNTPGQWRTLTSQEWKYLMGTRQNAAQLRTHATVNGVPGLILMPDGWTASSVSLTITLSNYTTNDINLTNWRKLESQGCVFLPAAGYRPGTDTSNCGTSGCYLPSTARDASTAGYVLQIGSSYTSAGTYVSQRSYGRSVRLVQDVDPSDEPEVPQAYVSSPPVGKTNMTYNGSSQTLINSSPLVGVGGSVKYRLGTSGEWGQSTTDFSATDAGNYIVQWFVEHTGDINQWGNCYQSSDVHEIHVTIKRRTASAPSPSPTIAATSSLTYNGTAQNLVTTTGDIQSGYTTAYSIDGGNTWSTTIPKGTNAGDYEVLYKFYKGDNEEYVPSPNTVNVNIAKADLSVDLPASTNSIPYDGTEKTLLEIDPVADCVIWYKLGDGDWTTTPPTRTDAGDYSVQYKIVPNNENYNTIGPNTVTVTILDYPTVYDNADPTAKLTELLNTPSDLKVKRTIYADDEYNTICLPFALDASALASSPLAGYNRLKAFKGAQVSGTGASTNIDIFVEDATAIEAGVPYLISYPSAHADIVDPVFTGITVSTAEPGNVEADGVTFQGMFAQVHIDQHNGTKDYLFLGANSQLYWPLTSENGDESVKMRGFRAYFIIDRNAIPAHVAPRGTRARFVNAPQIITSIIELDANQCTKFIENGSLIILKNGIKYNAQGQVVK